MTIGGSPCILAGGEKHMVPKGTDSEQYQTNIFVYTQIYLIKANTLFKSSNLNQRNYLL